MEFYNFMLFKILISGDGGQGVQTMADIISQAAFSKDYFVSYVPNYGLEQRGGSSLAYLQISDDAVAYPKFSSPDVLLIMSDEARGRVSDYIGKSASIFDIKDYLEYLNENNVNKISYNVFFLGLLAKILDDNKIGLSKEIFSVLEKKLGKKPNWEENKRYYLLGSK